MLFPEVLIDPCRESLGGVVVSGIPGKGVDSAGGHRKNSFACGGVDKLAHAAKECCNVRCRNAIDDRNAIRRVGEIAASFCLSNGLPGGSRSLAVGRMFVG